MPLLDPKILPELSSAVNSFKTNLINLIHQTISEANLTSDEKISLYKGTLLSFPESSESPYYSTEKFVQSLPPELSISSAKDLLNGSKDVTDFSQIYEQILSLCQNLQANKEKTEKLNATIREIKSLLNGVKDGLLGTMRREKTLNEANEELKQLKKNKREVRTALPQLFNTMRNIALPPELDLHNDEHSQIIAASLREKIQDEQLKKHGKGRPVSPLFILKEIFQLGEIPKFQKLIGYSEQEPIAKKLVRFINLSSKAQHQFRFDIDQAKNLNYLLDFVLNVTQAEAQDQRQRKNTGKDSFIKLGLEIVSELFDYIRLYRYQTNPNIPETAQDKLGQAFNNLDESWGAKTEELLPDIDGQKLVQIAGENQKKIKDVLRTLREKTAALLQDQRKNTPFDPGALREPSDFFEGEYTKAIPLIKAGQQLSPPEESAATISQFYDQIKAYYRRILTQIMPNSPQLVSYLVESTIPELLMNHGGQYENAKRIIFSMLDPKNGKKILSGESIRDIAIPLQTCLI